MKMSAVFGPTIQGEGKSLGLEVMFIRLSMCNLHCVWCDTPYTWNWKQFDKSKEIIEMSINEIVEQLQKSEVKAVVISGGEPFLQQKELITLIHTLKLLGYWVEIETNGTIVPTSEFVRLIDQINCSPKLANSGDPFNLRIKEKALQVLVQSGKANFKFVVSTDDDIQEIVQLVRTHKMQEVYLMPEGITKEALQQKEQQVKTLCQVHGFHFTQRLHIIELGGGRLV